MTATDRPLRTYRIDPFVEYRYNPATDEIEYRDVGGEDQDWVTSTFDARVVRRLAQLIETPYEP